MRVLKILLLGWLVCFAMNLRLACGADSDLGKDIDIPYQKFVLANGLTLIVHEDHKAPIVAVNVWYHVGSKDEKPGRTGFAHLFEHPCSTEARITTMTISGHGTNRRHGPQRHDQPDRTNYFETRPNPSSISCCGWNRIGWDIFRGYHPGAPG